MLFLAPVMHAWPFVAPSNISKKYLEDKANGINIKMGPICYIMRRVALQPWSHKLVNRMCRISGIWLEVAAFDLIICNKADEG